MAWLVDGRLQWYRGEVLATRESGGEEGEGGQGEPADLWETLCVLWEDSEGWDHRPDDEAAQAGWEELAMAEEEKAVAVGSMAVEAEAERVGGPAAVVEEGRAAVGSFFCLSCPP